MQISNSQSILNRNECAPFLAQPTAYEKIAHVAYNLLTISTPCAAVSALLFPVSWWTYLTAVPAFLTARKGLEVLFGYMSYPAAQHSMSHSFRMRLNVIRSKHVKQLRAQGFDVSPLTLQKSGISYAAFVITHPEARSRDWAIEALGAAMFMEGPMERIANRNRCLKVNTLMINGPSVGESSGAPTRYQFGAGFEAGMQYLEKEKKARHIILHGFSLGGGMMAEGILQHHFIRSDVEYLVIFDRTFSRVSEIVKERYGPWADALFRASGQQLDGVKAVEKLSRLKIRHIVINHFNYYPEGDDTDGAIPDIASLAAAVEESETVSLLVSSQVFHTAALPENVKNQLNRQIAEFLSEGDDQPV